MADKLADPGAMIAVARVSDQARADATAYMTRKGYGDLLPMLGLVPKAAPTGWAVHPCPACAAPIGSKCRKDAGGVMVRPHASRARLSQ